MAESRIACLLPSATELCCALGLRERLVGVSHECDHPPEVRGLPVLTSSSIDAQARGADIDRQVRARIGAGLSLYEVDEAALVAAAPDLVLTQDTCAVCAVSFAEVVASVRTALGSHVQVLSLSPSTVEDVLQDLGRVAAAAGVPERAVPVVASLGVRLDALRERLVEPRPRVLHLEWLEPPMVAGHWTPELLRIAGGEPVLAHDGVPTKRESWDAIAASDPDVVLLAPCGYPLAKARREAAALYDEAAFSALKAVQRGEVWALDGNAYFNRPGPRLVDSAELVAAILRGDHVHPDRAERLPRNGHR